MDVLVQEEERLKFLVSGSYDALPSSYLKLRSYLNSYSAALANVHGLKLPKCFTKTELTCRRCFLPWSGGSCSIKLLPVKKRKKKPSKTRVSSKKANPRSEAPKNRLVLKCKICNSITHFYLLKSAKTVKVVPQDENEVEMKMKTKKKKKKRKKDKTCGLNITLQSSLKMTEPPKKSSNKSNSSASKPNGAPNSAANSNRNVQKVNVKVKNSQSVHQSRGKKIQQPIKSKKPCSNATKLKCKTSKEKNKNLKKLKKLVLMEQKEAVKKTLKDFLTLI